MLDTDESNKPYAMKIIPRRKGLQGFVKGKCVSEMDKVMLEVAIMKKLVGEI